MSEYISLETLKAEVDKLKKENLLYLRIIEHGFEALNHAQDVINNLNTLDPTLKHNYKLRYFMQKYRCARNRFVRMKRNHDFIQTADTILKINKDAITQKVAISEPMELSDLINQIQALPNNQQEYFETKSGFNDRVLCKPCKVFFGRSYTEKFIFIAKERPLKLHIETTAHKLAVREYRDQLKKKQRNKLVQVKDGKMEINDDSIPSWVDNEIEIVASMPTEELEKYINPFTELINNEELPDLSDNIEVMEWLITKGEPQDRGWHGGSF
jgi:hypothetical protein